MFSLHEISKASLTPFRIEDATAPLLRVYMNGVKGNNVCLHLLHLCTFKTPTCRRFMSAKVGSLCAFEMRKGVTFQMPISRIRNAVPLVKGNLQNAGTACLVSVIKATYGGRLSPAKRACQITLHLCTFKTPTCRRFMSAKVGSLCAFQMRKGVKRRPKGSAFEI
jgi:hypothetical protein